jgi:hypothetical protein
MGPGGMQGPGCIDVGMIRQLDDIQHRERAGPISPEAHGQRPAAEQGIGCHKPLGLGPQYGTKPSLGGNAEGLQHYQRPKFHHYSRVNRPRLSRRNEEIWLILLVRSCGFYT